MMYRSDAKVLALCKKMQMVEGDYFVIFPGNEIRHCTGFDIENVRRSEKVEPGKKIRMEPSSFDACISSLANSGMIRRFGTSPAGQVTHDGWNHREVIRRERREFLMTHALFPSFVSLATTAIIWAVKYLIP